MRTVSQNMRRLPQNKRKSVLAAIHGRRCVQSLRLLCQSEKADELRKMRPSALRAIYQRPHGFRRTERGKSQKDVGSVKGIERKVYAEKEKNNDVEIVKENYNKNAQLEWERLEGFHFEFEIAKHYLKNT